MIRIKLIDRCYSCTIHKGHFNLKQWILNVAVAYDESKIDYAAIALEASDQGKVHLQPFIVFNESCWTLKEGNKTKTFKPTELFGDGSGDYRKARSLSGARDYSVRRGIHINKPGLIRTFEFGHWVDPAYNSSLRTRLSYEFGQRIAQGESVVDLAIQDPSGVLVVGEKQLEDLKKLRGGVATEHQRKRPYYYIGRSELENYLSLYDDLSYWDEEE